MQTKREYEHGSLVKVNKRGVGGALALLLLLPLAAWAGGVVTSCTEAALRAAMVGGGVVTFACDGTITLAGTLTNNVDLTLDGSGHNVTISGGGAVRVFCVNTNVSFTVVNVTIADGASQGGSAILNLGGVVTLTGATFRSNIATVTSTSEQLTLQASGGAIYNRGGTVNATDCSFADNIAQPAWWTPCNLAFGGAIYNSGTVTLDLCTLTRNSATGGPYDFSSVSAGEGSGGAIFNQGTLTIDRTTLCCNTASGGSVVGYGGSGGEAKGASICNLGSLWISRSTFANNVVFGGAGGNGHDGFPDPAIGNGGNGGGGGEALGGALFVGGPSRLVNCTLVGNQARGGSGGEGGRAGFWVDPGTGLGRCGTSGSGGFGGAACGAVYDVTGLLRLTNCTIVFNSSEGGPGGPANWGPPIGPPGVDGMAAGALQTANGISANCLLAGNFPSDCTGSLADAGHNLNLTFDTHRLA
jgi:hypothetical protein